MKAAARVVLGIGVALQLACAVVVPPPPPPQGPPPPPPPPPVVYRPSLPAPGAACLAWRQTGECSARGPREPGGDRACEDVIRPGSSGFCECVGGGVVEADCGHPASNCLTVCSAVSWMAPMRPPPPSTACIAWRQTGSCRASGPREPYNDKVCTVPIDPRWSGFCECAKGVRIGVNCGHPPSSCVQACRAGVWQ